MACTLDNVNLNTIYFTTVQAPLSSTIACVCVCVCASDQRYRWEVGASQHCHRSEVSGIWQWGMTLVTSWSLHSRKRKGEETGRHGSKKHKTVHEPLSGMAPLQ